MRWSICVISYESARGAIEAPAKPAKTRERRVEVGESVRIFGGEGTVVQSLERLAETGKPMLCLEVNPPRGTDVDGVLRRLEGALEGVDLLNITDCALAKMRLAALPFGALVKQRLQIEPLVNLSCRDRNMIALQADLLAAWALGVRSVVALTGDAVTVGDAPETKGVFEVNSVGLLRTIEKLNSGRDVVGHELKGKPAFWPGVVVNPNVRNTAAEIRRLQRKIDAGARYALSQPVFEGESAEAFFRQAASCKIPILMGLMPLKSAQAAVGISRVPGIKMPEGLLAQIEGKPDSEVSSFFIEHCVHLARHCTPLVRGFHVISGPTPRLALELVRALSVELKGSVGIQCGAEKSFEKGVV